MLSILLGVREFESLPLHLVSRGGDTDIGFPSELTLPTPLPQRFLCGGAIATFHVKPRGVCRAPQSSALCAFVKERGKAFRNSPPCTSIFFVFFQRRGISSLILPGRPKWARVKSRDRLPPKRFHLLRNATPAFRTASRQSEGSARSHLRAV